MQSEKLLAAMDLYQDAFMLVDTTVHKWRILHLNLMAANEIGAPWIRMRAQVPAACAHRHVPACSACPDKIFKAFIPGLLCLSPI